MLTSDKSPQLLEQVNIVIIAVLCIAELDVADTTVSRDIETPLIDVACNICSTYHTVLKASLGPAVFHLDMLFSTPLLADLNKSGDYSQLRR